MNNTKMNNAKKDNCYDVEYIITRRTEGKKNFYLIKWEGYPIKDCSWEPLSHLSNVMDMVNEFEDNFPNSIEQKALKEFCVELRKYEHKKFLQKKRLMKRQKGQKLESNKIIISLEDVNTNYSKTQNDDEKPKIEINSISICDNENDVNKENEYKDNGINYDKINNDEEDNIKNVGKLIKPIIIW